MSKIEYVSVDDVSKLQLHIYTLGYYPMGESIFIVLYDSETHKVLQSIYIDCFEQNGINRMEPFLAKYNIDNSKLDFIIWTHPDKDHSVGFHKIIENYASKKTIFLLPDGIEKPYYIFNNSSFLTKFFLEIFKKKYKKQVEKVNVSNKRKNPLIYGSTKYNDGDHKDIDFEIEILTPFADQAFFKTYLSNAFKKNDISISLIIRFAGQSFYFGGDTEDPAIKEIAKDRLLNIIFIKIPHHASETSKYLPGILKQIKVDEMDIDEIKMDDAISITTSFKNGHVDLPDNNILNKYKNISSYVLQTKSLKQSKENYGIWEIIYNVEVSNFDKPIPYADASTYYSVNR